MPDNAGNISDILKWGWVALTGLGVWIWQRTVKQIDSNSKELQDHMIEDLKSHDNFVHKDDLSELKLSIYSRFDKLDAKSDKILDRVMVGVTRDEFKSELKDVYASLESIRLSKQDKQ